MPNDTHNEEAGHPIQMDEATKAFLRSNDVPGEIVIRQRKYYPKE